MTLWLAASSSGCTAFGNLGKLIEPAAAVPVVIAQCPPRKTYDKATVQKSAAELQGLIKSDPAAATPVLMHDYRTLRQGCDAIETK